MENKIVELIEHKLVSITIEDFQAFVINDEKLELLLEEIKRNLKVKVDDDGNVTVELPSYNPVSREFIKSVFPHSLERLMEEARKEAVKRGKINDK